jgi:Zn finger protein HypA/HybF involved in hydrogenase expression
MAISMDRFDSEGHFATYDPHMNLPDREAVFKLQCRCCGFEPEAEMVVAPRICPKCHSTSWERFAHPGSILKNADRYVA